jgi:hypothetical protein
MTLTHVFCKSKSPSSTEHTVCFLSVSISFLLRRQIWEASLFLIWRTKPLLSSEYVCIYQYIYIYIYIYIHKRYLILLGGLHPPRPPCTLWGENSPCPETPRLNFTKGFAPQPPHTDNTKLLKKETHFHNLCSQQIEPPNLGQKELIS